MRKSLVALLCALGCARMYDPCFAPSSLVSDLRVLAVRLDPPEALFDPQTLAAPEVRVRALVALTEVQTPLPVFVRARTCGKTNDDGTCAAPGPWEAQSEGDQFALPEVHVTPSPAVIREAYANDPLNGYGGARVTLEIEASSPNRGTVRATKLLIVNPAQPGYVPNHGFEVPRIALRFRDGHEQLVDETSPLQLSVGESVGVAPVLEPAQGQSEAAETYEVTDLSGRTVQLRERISYSFFVTPHVQYGPFGRPQPGSDVADEPAPGDPYPPGGLVALSPLYEGQARAYVVARDGRGGEAFRAFGFVMADHRVCANGPDMQNRCADLEIGCQ